MRSGIYPESFLNKIVYHAGKKAYYKIIHLPKKYTDKSSAHFDEYYIRVIKLTENGENISKLSVLHIHPNNVDKITVQRHISNIENYDEIVDYTAELVPDEVLTQGLVDYINEIHKGSTAYKTKSK